MTQMIIRKSVDADVPAILAIINDAARAYRGVIPADQWHEPYMPKEHLENEISKGVVFWVAEEDGRLLGVMGIQDKGDVALVRHAYVASSLQRSGVGTKLLEAALGWARANRVDRIVLWPTSRSVPLYLRHGFARGGEVMELKVGSSK